MHIPYLALFEAPTPSFARLVTQDPDPGFKITASSGLGMGFGKSQLLQHRYIIRVSILNELCCVPCFCIHVILCYGYGIAIVHYSTVQTLRAIPPLFSPPLLGTRGP
jgi:hypothetical protein